MAADLNCVLCQYPLNQCFFKNLINKTDTLSCNHQYHHLCLIAFSDAKRLENAQDNSLSCPLCREVNIVNLPTPEQEVKKWIQVANRTAIVFSTASGVVMGYWMARSGNTPTALEKVLSVTTQIPRSIFVSSLTGCVAHFASKALLRTSVIQSATQKGMLSLFHYIADIKVVEGDLSNDSFLHKVTHSNSSLGTQADWAMRTFVTTYLNVGINLIQSSTLFDDPIEQRALAPILSFLQDCEANTDRITQEFTNYLNKNCGDLLVSMQKAGMNLFKGRGNQELKEEAEQVFCEFMRQQYGPQLTIQDIQPATPSRFDLPYPMGYRILFIYTLNNWTDTGSNDLNNLVLSLIAECRNPSDVFTLILKNLFIVNNVNRAPFDLEQPLDFYRAIDPMMNDFAWETIYKGRLEDFQARGLTIQFQDEG